MENKKMNFFQKVGHSLYDFESYLYFNKLTVGKAFSYLILLTLLLGLLCSIKPVIDYNGVINDGIKVLVDKTPDFKLENGKLNVEGKMPVKINSGSTAVVIDTTGKTTKESLADKSEYVLITADEIIQKRAFTEKIVKFKDMGNFTFDKDKLVSIMPYLKLVGILIVIFYPIGVFLAYLLNALILSIVGVVIDVILNKKIPYGNIFKLGIYALTLPTILVCIVDAIPLNIPFEWFIKMLIAAIYVGIALKKIGNEIDKEQEQP